jgi:ABC-type amino acid transport substrate-binding protein
VIGKRLKDLRYRLVLLVGMAVLGIAGTAAAQEAVDELALRVGTTVAPPFAMRDDGGEWYGIAIDLWRALADEMRLEFELVERPFDSLLAEVESGELDLAVAAVTITSERETRLDFSHPFHTTGLGIATPLETPLLHWWRVAEHLLSSQFVAVVGILLAVLLVAATCVWLFERRRNAEMFGGSPSAGIGKAFWWSAVTMTTVGYGDKAPRTLGGRTVAIAWMFISIIILSSFTAAITSSLTVSQLGGTVRDLGDLYRARVGVVGGTTAAAFLADEGIRSQSFPSTREGLAAAVAGHLDAVVQDAPILEYIVANEYPDKLHVLPQTFTRQDYGVAFQTGSGLREPFNRALLSYLRSDSWQSLLRRYL